MSKRTISLVAVVSFILIAAAGCRKKTPIAMAPPPPAQVKEVLPSPPPPKAPVIRLFAAEPGTIQRGQATTLRWAVSDATETAIEPGIGTVPTNGSRQAFPAATTTYTLHAKGAGGAASATTAVTVTIPPPPSSPPPPAPKKTLSERLSIEVSDAYFDFDMSTIREDARAVLTRDAAVLKAIFSDFPTATIVIEGYCDERGSAEYNLALGDRRASSTKEFLQQLGVPVDRLTLLSYGKERPQCTEANEACWQKNRRVHFVAGSPGVS